MAFTWRDLWRAHGLEAHTTVCPREGAVHAPRGPACAPCPQLPGLSPDKRARSPRAFVTAMKFPEQFLSSVPESWFELTLGVCGFSLPSVAWSVVPPALFVLVEPRG